MDEAVWKRIPKDIIFEIFCHLQIEDLLRFERVSKAFCSFARMEEVWKYIYEEQLFVDAKYSKIIMSKTSPEFSYRTLVLSTYHYTKSELNRTKFAIDDSPIPRHSKMEWLTKFSSSRNQDNEEWIISR